MYAKGSNLSHQVLLVFVFFFSWINYLTYIYKYIIQLFSYKKKKISKSGFYIKGLTLRTIKLRELGEICFEVIWQLFVRMDKSTYVMHLSDFLYPMYGVFLSLHIKYIFYRNFETWAIYLQICTTLFWRISRINFEHTRWIYSL